MIITEFDQSVFLAEYWQKKPCVIRHFITAFEDPIDEHELAGLAQEEDIDSRVVSYANQKWCASQGPFERFDDVCVGAWSLLVQGVDRYIDEVDDLSALVDFIPNWRLDDVMISFSNEGAGVGPHTDEYDVFIIQGKGKRRWQVGLPGDYSESIPHPLLRQIDGFDAIIDEILLPGDVVYIPPKHPHNGIALSECLNYSVGFRAPSSLEMMTGLIDEGIIDASTSERYTDPDIGSLRSVNTRVAAIEQQELVKLKQQLSEFVYSDSAESAILQLLSRQNLPCDEDAKANYSPEEIKQQLLNGAVLARMTGVKPVYAEQQTNASFLFFIDGNSFSVNAKLRPTFEILLNSKEAIMGRDLDNNVLQELEFITIVKDLVNAGYWVLLI